VEMHLSLSFTHTTAVASAVAITEEGRPRPKSEPVDPKAELAAAFKEARAMLDGLTVEDRSVEESQASAAIADAAREEGPQEDR